MADLTPEQREAFYDAEIAPAIRDIAQRCQDNGLSFLALTEWGADDHGRTCTIAKDGSFFFRWVEAAARCCRAAGGAFNLDPFMMAVARDTVKNRRPHNSIALHRWGVDPDPAKRSPQPEGAQ